MSSQNATHTGPSTPASDRNIRFVLDGSVVCVADVAPTTTVLEYLRDHAGRTGTKEGCAEGDCGACTVVLGECDPAADGSSRMRYRAINSCIRFLPTIDGKELITVESLAGEGDDLHPVQQAMVDQHASQCGFCTPGFVMSLFALYQHNAAPQREDILDALAGNLCRCTGYRPIIDAGLSMHAYAPPSHWSREQAQAAEHVALLQTIQREIPLALPGFFAPRNIEQLATAYAAAPESLLLAGGTDIGLWVTKALRDLPPIIYLGDVAELHRLDDVAGQLHIGAAVALTDAWQAIVERHPALAELAQRFASSPVRNSGTLCGNIANGSPIGDAMPALIVLGARIELRCGQQRRELALEDFYLGYQKKDLGAGEFVVAVNVPSIAADAWIASYKLSKRIDQDISAVCAAFAFTVRDGNITQARIAFGGMAAVPARAKTTEAALLGQPWTQASIDAAVVALKWDFTPLSDMRASDAYRLRGAGALLQRFFLEHSHDAPLLRTQQTVSTSASATGAPP